MRPQARLTPLLSLVSSPPPPSPGPKNNTSTTKYVGIFNLAVKYESKSLSVSGSLSRYNHFIVYSKY